MRWFGWFRTTESSSPISDDKFIEFQKLVIDGLPEGYEQAIVARGDGAMSLINSFVFNFYLTHLNGTDGANGYAWQCKSAIVKGFPLVCGTAFQLLLNKNDVELIQRHPLSMHSPYYSNPCSKTCKVCNMPKDRYDAARAAM